MEKNILEEKPYTNPGLYFAILRDYHRAAGEMNQKYGKGFRFLLSFPVDVEINGEILLKPEMFGKKISG